MFLEIILAIGLVIFAIDSFFFIAHYAKITEISNNLSDLVDIFEEEDESEEDREIRERIAKTMYA